MGMTGRQIFDNFDTAPGAGELESARNELEQLALDDDEIGQEIKSAAAALEASWRGEAAGAAQRGAGPLAVDHDVTAQQTHTAQDLLRRQVESFGHAKSNVVPVPDVPDTPPTMVDVINGGDDALYFQKRQQALAAEEQNIRTMSLWDNHSTYNEQMMPTQYGQGGDGTFTMADTSSGGRASVDAGSPQVGGSTSSGGHTTAAGAGAFGGSLSAASGSSSGSRGSASRGTDGSTAGTTRSAAASAVPPATSGIPGPAGRPVSETPGGRPGTTGLPGGSTGFGPGPGGNAGRGGTVGGTRGGVPGAGGPRGGGPGPGGAVRGGAPGSAGGARGGGPGFSGQPGRTAGGVPGATGAQAGRGAGGRMGGAGGPMGGAGAGRGKGDEGSEHRNKYALPEQLDDGLQREVDEHGERTLDESGQTVVPPVIGETGAEQQHQPQQPEQPPAKPGPAATKPTGVVKSSNPYAPPSAVEPPRQT